MKQWAILSVNDKRGIERVGRWLVEQDIGILASGGTADYLSSHDVQSTRIETITGFDQLLGGRVKTLHPVLYAGILATESEADQTERRAVDAPDVAVVVVDLYAFEDGLAANLEPRQLIESIDIGGVSLIRAAAKNYARVLVVTGPDQYAALTAKPLLDWSLDERRALAAEAFTHTAYYDAMIGRALAGPQGIGPSSFFVLAGRSDGASLRYGENPHQAAGRFRLPASSGWSDARLLQGKALSYNNVLDADAAFGLASELPNHAVVAVKHQIPCGVAVASAPLESYRKVYAADPVSIFGGVVAVHGTVNADLAHALTEIFLDVIVAEEYDDDARAILAAKKNLRVVQLPDHAQRRLDVRMITGGFLAQEADRLLNTHDQFRLVAGPVVNAEAWKDIDLAWKCAAHVRSNAVVVVSEGSAVGIGGGETNRIDAARHALERAGTAAEGAVLASDGSFPFGDVILEAAKAGIRVVVEPGGAIRDAESIQAAEHAGISLLFTDERHFRH